MVRIPVVPNVTKKVNCFKNKLQNYARQWLEFDCPVTITAMGALRAPKPPPRGLTSLSTACLAALLPAGRLQGRCLALSAAVDKYKPVTRRVAARRC